MKHGILSAFVLILIAAVMQQSFDPFRQPISSPEI